MAETVVIADLATLVRWREAVRATFALSLLPPARFDLPSFSEQMNRGFTHEATRLHRACGCATAGLAMTAATLFATASLALDPRGAFGVPLVGWLGYLLLVVGAAAAGKIAGLGFARWRMIRLAQEAEDALLVEAKREAGAY